MNRHNLSKDEPIPFRWFALTVLWLLCHTDVSTCFQPPTRMIRHRASSTLYYAFSLTSALESCIGDKDILPWINTTDNTDVDDDIDSSHCRTVPLYPLAACYLPTGQHQLRNIEPRNLKMANDLGIGGRFCVVCSAVDTGRIAAVGTMFRILHMDPQTDPVSGQLLRILLTCEAEDLVNIRAIQNPKAAKWKIVYSIRKNISWPLFVLDPIRPATRRIISNNSIKPYWKIIIESLICTEMVRAPKLCRPLPENAWSLSCRHGLQWTIMKHPSGKWHKIGKPFVTPSVKDTK